MKTPIYVMFWVVGLTAFMGQVHAGMSVIGPPKQQQPARSQVSPGVEDPAVAELMEQRRKQAEAYEALNRTNPLSESFDPSASQGAPAGTGPFAQIQSLLSNPVAQATFSWVSNPAVMEAVQAVSSHPHRMWVVYCEVALLIVMLVFRAWRRSKVTHWARKLWVSFYTLAGAWVIGAIIIPSLIIGTPYTRVLSAVLGSTV